MDRFDAPDKPDRWHRLREWCRRPLPLESETTWFILLSFLDLLLTFVLLQDGGFRESNPLALRVLSSVGLRGLILFKFGLVTFVCVLTQIIARRQLPAARTVIQFAIVASAIVLLFSAWLLAGAAGLV
jgi:hypothetical protein